MNNIILSVCIPSYNRPTQLGELLASIDARSSEIEIVICEDCAPDRLKVANVVSDFIKKTTYPVYYHENETNLGYDGNLRKLIHIANGEFVLFMGDDDLFSPGKLDLFIDFIKLNSDVSYILRSYYGLHPNGSLEPFNYLPKTTRFSPGVDTCIFLYKRTVSIAGVTFKRSSALDYDTNQFDGTLLYQLYLVSEIALNNTTIYCDIPVAIAVQSFRLDNPQFGTALTEKAKFKPGKITAQNSVNYTKGFFVISDFIDNKYGLDITKSILIDLSKYSYPFLSIQRKRGHHEFLKYAILLARETGLNKTWHYYFYSAALLLFGEKFCDKSIIYIKKFLGYTPKL